MADQQKADDKQAQRASTVGVDVNEEQVRTHPGFEKASDQPHPNVAHRRADPGRGDEPADVRRPDGPSVRARPGGAGLSANLVYENGIPSTRGEHLDPVIESLEDALKALKAAKS
jgi:hypothetical protein